MKQLGKEILTSAVNILHGNFARIWLVTWKNNPCCRLILQDISMQKPWIYYVFLEKNFLACNIQNNHAGSARVVISYNELFVIVCKNKLKLFFYKPFWEAVLMTMLYLSTGSNVDSSKDELLAGESVVKVWKGPLICENHLLTSNVKYSFELRLR